MIVVPGASAAVKLVVHEAHSDVVRASWDEPVRWVAPSIILPEVSVAIAAARRSGRLRGSAVRQVHRHRESVGE